MSPQEQEQEPGADAPLRAALDHAPDRDLRPPPAVRAAVLRAAHAAVPLRPAPWRRWFGLDQGWGSPRLWTALASVASLGLALNLAWHVSTAPEVADDGARADTRPAPVAAAAPPPAAKVAEAAPAAAPAAPAATLPVPREERRPLDRRLRPQAPAEAPPVDAPRAAAAAPPLVATSVAPPLADAAPMAFGRAVASPWPEPLARLAPVLSADGDWPAAGWQVTSLPAGSAAPPKAWWRALLQASAGRWQGKAGPPPADAAAAPAWQVSGPEGQRFTLTLAGGAAWLQAGGATWRATPVPPLP